MVEMLNFNVSDRPVSSCHDTEYGCCQDEKTASPGPNRAGCPSMFAHYDELYVLSLTLCYLIVGAL